MNSGQTCFTKERKSSLTLFSVLVLRVLGFEEGAGSGCVGGWSAGGACP